MRAPRPWWAKKYELRPVECECDTQAIVRFEPHWWARPLLVGWFVLQVIWFNLRLLVKG